jgi:hypothetical protein
MLIIQFKSVIISTSFIDVYFKLRLLWPRMRQINQAVCQPCLMLPRCVLCWVIRVHDMMDWTQASE